MQFGKSIKADRDALAPLIRLLAQHGDVPHALEHPSVRIDDIYSMGELLGLGQIGKVYRGKHRLTGEKQLQCALSPYADRLSARVCNPGENVAIKIVDKTKFSARLSALRRVATREIIVLTK